MNTIDSLSNKIHRTQNAVLWALAANVLVVSIPNVCLANWTATYQEFWSSTLGGKPMGTAAVLICRFSVAYRLDALIWSTAVLAPLFRLRFQIRCWLMTCAFVFAAIQMLLSSYFLWYEWWVAVVHARLF
jgi:hypothetical protein